MTKPLTFQELIQKLNNYWSSKGCLIMQPYDLEVGAGTFSPHTFLRALGPEPWNAAYVEELKSFPAGRFDDQVDASSRAFGMLVVAARPTRSVVFPFGAR